MFRFITTKILQNSYPNLQISCLIYYFLKSQHNKSHFKNWSAPKSHSAQTRKDYPIFNISTLSPNFQTTSILPSAYTLTFSISLSFISSVKASSSKNINVSATFLPESCCTSFSSSCLCLNAARYALSL